MAEIQDRIRVFIRDDVTAKKLVDVYRVAEAMRLEFPEHHLQDIVGLVSEEIVKAGGNAHWDKNSNL